MRESLSTPPEAPESPEYKAGYAAGLASPSVAIMCPFDGRTKAGKAWWAGFMVGDAERCAAKATPAPAGWAVPEGEPQGVDSASAAPS